MSETQHVWTGAHYIVSVIILQVFPTKFPSPLAEVNQTSSSIIIILLLINVLFIACIMLCIDFLHDNFSGIYRCAYWQRTVWACSKQAAHGLRGFWLWYSAPAAVCCLQGTPRLISFSTYVAILEKKYWSHSVFPQLETKFKDDTNKAMTEREQPFRCVVKFSSTNLLESLRHCASTGMNKKKLPQAQQNSLKRYVWCIT